MPLPIDSHLIAATCFAVAGTTVVLILLAVERFATRLSAQAALVATAVLSLGSAAGGLWRGSWEPSLALGLLAAGTALVVAVRTKPFQGALALVTRPVTVM